MNLRLVGELLRRDGFEPVLAAGGAEALAITASQAIDLVLLDLVMPDVDGIAVLTALRDRGVLGRLPVVVVMGLGDRAVRQHALALGAVDFMTKPFDRVELTCKARNLTELGQLRAVALAESNAAAAASQLQRVEAAVHGLPIVVFEMAGGAGAWAVGDIRAQLGVGRDEMLSGLWVDTVVPADRDVVRDALQRPSSDGQPRSVRFRVRVGGGTAWRSLTASTTGEVVRGVVSDVDQQVKVEAALVQARKVEAVGMMAGVVAHDFNNILAVIAAYANFLDDSLAEHDPNRADVGEIRKAAERGVALTTQLTSFVRSDTPPCSAVDLNMVAGEFARTIERTLGTAIAVEFTPAQSPALARIDPVELHRLLLNLAVNARDAMPKGGTLSISLDIQARDGKEASPRLRVADTGVGMSEATKQRIFDPFFTTKPRGHGTGLGLATALGIVEQA